MSASAGPSVPTVASHRSESLRAADGASAQVSSFGAHVLSWAPSPGDERLYLSRCAVLDGRAPIRGGVPIAFPQFSNLGPLPAHGLVRTAVWTPMPAAHARDPMDRSSSHWVLASTGADLDPNWPHAFRCEFSVQLRPGAMDMTLVVHNTGQQAFDFQAALHTYLSVLDAKSLRVQGLQGHLYTDRTRGGTTQQQQLDAHLDIRGERDRIYGQVRTPVHVVDGARVTSVSMQGFEDVVVWNPGPVRAKAIPDMLDEDHLHMLCIEAGAILKPIHLSPKSHWQGTQTLSVLG